MTFASAGSSAVDSTSKTFTLNPAALGLAAGEFVIYSVITESTTEYAAAMASANVNNGDGWDIQVEHTTLGSYSITVFSGEITSTASETVTITTSSGSPAIRSAGWPFSTTAGYSAVALDTSGTVSSTTFDMPSLTPGHGAGELYFFFGFAAGTGFTAGPTSGFTYAADGNSNPLAFNPDCGDGAQQPVLGGTDSGLYGIAVLLYETAAALTATAALSVAPSEAATREHGATGQATGTVAPSGAVATWPWGAILDTTGSPVLDTSGGYILDTSGSSDTGTAPLSITPSETATAARGHAAAASLQVTPAGTAAREHAATAQASEAVTPSGTAAAGDGTAASLSATPSETAQAQHGHSAAAPLSVTPSETAEAGRGQSASASMEVTPEEAASAGDGTGASLAAVPSLTAEASAGHAAEASLGVAPALTAAAPGVAGAALEAVPDLSAQASRGQDATASLAAAPSETAGAAHGHAAQASETVTVTPGLTAAAGAGASLDVAPDLGAEGARGHAAQASLDTAPEALAGQEHDATAGADLEAAPSLAANAGTIAASSLAVAPETTATARHGHSAAASLQVTPEGSAQAGDSAGASLGAAPGVAAEAAHGHYAGASLEVTPAGTAAREHAATAQASEAVTPSGTAAAQHGHAGTASLEVAPEAEAAASSSLNLQAQGSLSVAPSGTARTTQGHAARASLAVAPSLTAYAPPPFPASPLDLQCDLLLGTDWTSVTSYAYQRDGSQAPVSITRGRPDESSQANPASCSWQWNNRDGRFSPKNPLSPYYGLLGRNTPVRWSAPASGAYLRLEADNADRAVVADNSDLDITGSIDMRIALRLSDWQGGALACKWDGGGCWAWLLNGDGTLAFGWFDSGGTYQAVTSSQPVPYTGGDLALRATMDATSGTVAFYTAAVIGGTWTQLGAAASGTGGASTSIGVSHVSALQVGYSYNFTPGQICGRVYEYQLYDGIAGTLAADGIFSAQAAGTATWTDAQGNTWGLAGGAEISSRDYRFHGEMSSQPPRWDVTGADMYVAAAAGGPLRRLSQGTDNAMSPMRRAVSLQQGDLYPVAYWPMEDGAASTVFGSAVPGGTAMTFDASPAPTLADDSSFLASAPLPEFNGSRFYGKVAPYAGGSTWVVRFLGKLGTMPASGDWSTLFSVSVAGGLSVEVRGWAGGNLELIGFTPGGATAFDTGQVGFEVDDDALWYSIEATPVSGGVQYALFVMLPGGTAGGTYLTYTGATAAGIVTQVAGNQDSFYTDTVIGHVQVQSTWQSLSDFSQPLNAWTGETAGARYARLAGENGYQVRIVGSPGQSAAMGPQSVATLSDLLQECETCDLGQQFEPRQCLALGYRTLASTLSQDVTLSLDYASAQLGGVNGDGTDSGLDPVYDDQLSRNDWTLTRGAASGSQGATVQYQLNDGSSMSISPPPTGIGDYADTQTVNCETDQMLTDIASWMVHTGTVDEARWPVIPLNLARAGMSALRDDDLQLDIGDYLQVTDAPDLVVYDPVRQLMLGTTEKLGGMHWTMEFNCVPESPYEVILLNDPVYGRVDTDGSSLASSVTATATALSVATDSGYPIWTTASGDFPFDLGIGGERVTVTGITGSSSPQTFTVTRSVNGVAKAQSAGADVRLWFAPVLSLA